MRKRLGIRLLQEMLFQVPLQTHKKMFLLDKAHKVMLDTQIHNSFYKMGFL